MAATGGNEWWPQAAGALGGVFGAGGIVGWMREKRRGRRDAQEFALELIDRYGQRIDALVKEVGGLEGRIEELSRRSAVLDEDNRRLRAENEALRAQLLEATKP